MRIKLFFIVVVGVYWLPLVVCNSVDHNTEFVDYIYNKYNYRGRDPNRPLPFQAFNRLMTDVGLNSGNNDTWVSYSDRNLTLFRRYLILEATGHYDNITEVIDRHQQSCTSWRLIACCTSMMFRCYASDTHKLTQFDLTILIILA